jgi:tripeptide aminopeptidase
MKNAILIFQEFNAMLPPEQRPEHTEGREGFYHLMKTYEGSVESFTAKYIVRDHDPEKFDQRKALMLSCADLINQKYGEGTIEVELVDQYRNMVEVIEPVMHIVDTAKEAMLTLGIEPINNPIRGGTDGAQLSYRGLPTPNIFNGGHNYHGPYEYVCLESMQKAMQVIVKIIELYANK